MKPIKSPYAIALAALYNNAFSERWSETADTCNRFALNKLEESDSDPEFTECFKKYMDEIKESKQGEPNITPALAHVLIEAMEMYGRIVSYHFEMDEYTTQKFEDIKDKLLSAGCTQDFIHLYNHLCCQDPCQDDCPSY